ncbi:MAG: beta-galactosidase [Oscillospiraceae bacterium]|nr:beta-galactosidase [Oscillospiraceae bacterium]
MIFGVDYYPEHWDKSEWKKQARIMRDGNFNTVRIAEFAWCRLEPEEDTFDFSWLDEIIDILAAEGIGVILGTPTAAPPKWLVNKYDVYMRDKYGRQRGYGSRRECCANNSYYIARSKVIVEQLAKRYGKNPNVIAWQIDNEFGCHQSTRCYCEHCGREFAYWLEKKYKSIDRLNKIYGTVFWSQEYSSFDDVILPAYTSCEGDYGKLQAHNPSLEMDFYRFSSDSWVRYQQMQIDIIRKYSDYPITHNMMGHFSDIDYRKLGEPLDITAWDNYIDNQWDCSDFENISMAHELMRGVKNKNFWVMEQQSGPCGWDRFGGTPRPGQLRLWTYQSIAHGCEGLLYFRFRSAPFGMEQYWLGVVDHDGVPRRRYYEIKQTGEELKKLSDIFVGAKNSTDVLLVKSYEEVWCHEIKCHTEGFDYRNTLYSYYRANNHLGTNPVCGGEDMIGGEYKVIYMPAYSMVSAEVEKRLEEYVQNGGTLVLTYLSGTRDVNNNIVTSAIPGRLRKLAGTSVAEFDSSRGDVELGNGFGVSKLWRDILEPETADIRVCYNGEYYKDSAAVTVNTYGKGRVWYVGCDLEESALLKLVKIISDEAGAGYISHPDGTEIIKRSVNGREYFMLLNYMRNAIDMGIRGKSLLSEKCFDGILDGYGVEIIDASK